MNQVIEELKADNEALRKVITDLADLNGQMSMALLARLVRGQQQEIDRQELEIASLKRQVKQLMQSVENAGLAIDREARKRETAHNVIDEKVDKLIARLKAKFDGESAK